MMKSWKLRKKKEEGKHSILPSRKKLFAFGLAMVCSFLCCIVPAMAATGGNIITDGFANLKNIVAAFVSSIGVLIVLWGLFEWGNSMQSQDGMMQSMAFKRIGGGLVMTLGPQLLNVLLPAAVA